MLVPVLKVALLLVAGIIGLVVAVALLTVGWKILQAILQTALSLIRGIVSVLSWLLRALFWLLTAPIALPAGAGTTWQRVGAELKEEWLTYLRVGDWRRL